jgi:hypothetical protein
MAARAAMLNHRFARAGTPLAEARKLETCRAGSRNRIETKEPTKMPEITPETPQTRGLFQRPGFVLAVGVCLCAALLIGGASLLWKWGAREVASIAEHAQPPRTSLPRSRRNRK